MAIRYIPRKTKVKMEFVKGVTLSDIIVGVIGVAGAVLFIASQGLGGYNWYLAVAWLAIFITMYFPVDEGVRLYSAMGLLVRFIAFKKKYSQEDVDKHGNPSIRQLMPFEGLHKERFIDFKDYYAEVIEVSPIEFGLLNAYKQDMLIRTFANALKRLGNGQNASVVKLNKAIIFDNYVQNEDRKFDSLMELQYEGEMTESEVEARSGVFEARVSTIELMNREEKIYKDYFYLVVYDKDRESLDNTVDGMMSTMANSVVPMATRKLIGRDLIVFLRSNYGKDFDERDLETITLDKHINWATPNQIKFKTTRTIINKQGYRSFVITDYPLTVGNAWGAGFFLLDRTNVVVNITPVQRHLAEKRIDKAIVELEGKLGMMAKSSKQLENNTHLRTLKELLAQLKNDGEQLYEVNMHITCEENARKEVRAVLKQYGYKYAEMFGRQVDAFISRSISRLDTVTQYLRDMPTSTLAALFPFISSALQDEKGIYIGYNEYPVFVDFFVRNAARVNSNMMIIGKSGSGKSYATKTLLANLACDNTKVFILDPEDEYTPLSYNLKGKVLDVGSSISGRLNPFHIITTLDSDEGGTADDYSTHLQFLEQFFATILPGIAPDAFEKLNNLIIEVYREKGIDSTTKLKGLKPEDYPIFDDLYKVILQKIKEEKDDYHRRNLQTVETYISKFATGGRNSNLWNGPMSIVTKENFVTFNFRSLLANRNEIIANAQMLLVFKYLDNEIIKNKDFNDKYHRGEPLDKWRKIIVAVDEAHVFINPKRPIALDFMAQMAKRIRKYGGMQIIITQNIKDFVGSPEIERQSSAVINASQYSFIFSLAPNDINDLVNLYRNAGEINKEEQDAIVTASVGQAFIITSALSRTSVKIEASETVRNLFS
ncbi:MAG: DUF87 domain-containing protein [Christensenellaceae bacterium]|nr:DUF87 domain-containing protein [Christensenellaceae bacterium]